MNCSIIGLSVRLPEGLSIEEFWNSLTLGKSFTYGMSLERQKLHVQQQNRIWGDVSKIKGMFLDDIDCFDKRLFNLSNPALIFADPRQRLLLESCYSAIEDAGINLSDLRGKNVGVFLAQDGFDMSSYFHNIPEEELLNQEFIIPGTISSFLASRIANVFDFRGPSMVIDGTCSSIYMAIHHACQAMEKGECDYALVGGATLFIEPWKSGENRPTSFESGVCNIKSFSENADGYCSSEGCGAFLLKRSSPDENDNFDSYGTIIGTGYNSGGKTRSFAQPNQEQQEILFRSLLDETGKEPSEVEYIEAHGIGSALGDAIEGNAFINVFGSEDRKPCYVSTIKPNIGHAQASSGIYSLLKALLSIRYNKILGISGLDSSKVNTAISNNRNGIEFLCGYKEWPKKADEKRLVFLSTYGASNVNAAVFIEEAELCSIDNPGNLPIEEELICLSAETEGQLEELKNNLLTFIKSGKHKFNIQELAYTLKVGREQLRYRFAAKVDSIESLQEVLKVSRHEEVLNKEIFWGDRKSPSESIKALKENKQELDRTLVVAFNEKRLSDLATLWVNGINIKWDYCYRNIRLNRLHLPTYTFAKERYWLPKSKAQDNITGKLHPLLHFNTSDLNEQKFTSVFTGKETFLIDHVVRGEKVLPGVAYLELIREAAKRSIEKPVLQFKNMTWLNPISVRDISKKINISIFEERDGFGYEVYSHAVDENNQESEIIHGQGSLSTASIDRPAVLDIEATRKRLNSKKTREECYQFYSKLGLVLGSTYKGIENLYYNEEESLSEIKIDRDNSFVWQLGLLDSTFQTGDLLTLSEEEGLRLPFCIRELHVFGDVSETCWAYAKKILNKKEISQVCSHDIDMLSEKGEVLLSLKGFVTIPLDGFQRQEALIESDKTTDKDLLLTVNPDQTKFQERTEKVILKLTAELLRLHEDDLTTTEELGDYGFDSIMMTRFANALNDYYNLDLLPTVFYSYSTIEKLAAYLLFEFSDTLNKKYSLAFSAEEEKNISILATKVSSNLSKRKKKSALPNTYVVNTRESTYNEPIAIIGLSGRFPGSPDLNTFWENIRDNKNLITEVPENRWNWRDYYGDPQESNGKTKSKWGGFIEAIDEFDPLFFGISPREAELMDPQQRIALEAVYHALEDAAIPVKKLRGSNTGMFIGVSSSDYSYLLNKNGDFSGQAQYSTGQAHSVLANRISYLLDLHGPSEPVDTACSSSLIAIHRAVENIRNGHCEIAIAGGVSALLSPELTLSFSKAGMLSDDGQCKTFDQSANGYVRGEGVGMIVLKSLKRAQEDGDHIYAVIKGTAENHGGKANTLTSPNPIAQKELLLKAYRQAQIDPRSVSYIEAHGTGTSLGDPIETEGLKYAFSELYKEFDLKQPQEPHIALGSVKTNIGHLEAAAGIAGVIKVILSLKSKILPGNPNLQNPNVYLRLENTPFRLQKETTSWDVQENYPRIAGVSSFGFGGANAHVVLEEYKDDIVNIISASASLILISARDKSILVDQARQLLNYVNRQKGLSLQDLAYTLQVGRDAMEEKVAFIVQDLKELKLILERYIKGEVSDTIYRNTLTGNEKHQDRIDKKSFLEDALRSKNLQLLAELWVNGSEINWTLLYEGQHPRRISLPGYAFERKRYWFRSKNKEMVSSIRLENISELHSKKELGYVEKETKELLEVVNLTPVQSFNVSNNLTEKLSESEVERKIREILKDVLFISEKINEDRAFVELGLDSVTGVEFINIINREFKVRLSATSLYDNSTIRKIRDCIMREISIPAKEMNLNERNDTVALKPNQKVILEDPSDLKLEFTEINNSMNPDSGDIGELRLTVQNILKEILYIDREIGTNTPFAELGLDSVTGVEFINILNKSLGVKLEATRLYDCSSVNLLSNYIHGLLMKSSSEFYGEVKKPLNNPPSLIRLEPLSGIEQENCIIDNASQRGISEKCVASDEIIAKVTEILSNVLYLENRVDENKPFIDLGLDSVVGVEFINCLNKAFDIKMEATKLYDHSSVRSLSIYISGLLNIKEPSEAYLYQAISTDEEDKIIKAQVNVDLPASVNLPKVEEQTFKPSSTSDQQSIAIVGLSGRYPQADNVYEFWKNIAEGRDCVQEIRNRWDVGKNYSLDATKTGKVYSKWLGQLDGIEEFDPLFFNISPSEAETMDPQHRIFLQECWRALEDGGFSRKAVQGMKCGTYVGIMSNEYSSLAKTTNDDASLAQIMTGNSNSIFAARLAYLLDLKGPAISIDTACSSSLVATHLACQALLSGEIDMAVTGGVSLYLSVENYRQMCAAGMLSPEGKCKTFDATADGFVPGEGAGVLILKRLSDAERDGDKIYGVIKGSGINQDGRTNGITAPSVSSQVELITDVYSKYNINPEDISYVEAHGTGTRLGDPIEVEALNKAFKARTGKLRYCGLGSVKSNTGHTSAAAGVAGITKVLFQLKNNKLAPTINFNKLNEFIDLENSPFYINTDLRDWNKIGNKPRIAAVSSFGFSGTNAHIVIEEYVSTNFKGSKRKQELVLLSAKSMDLLNEYVRNLKSFLEDNKDLELADVAYTLQTGREHFDMRFAVVAADLNSLCNTLGIYLEGKPSKALIGNFKSSEERFFLKGKAGEAYLREAINHSELENIAQLWVKGTDIDWKKLYSGGKPNKVSLPTYPFAKERYWINIQKNIDLDANSSRLHPLVHFNSSVLKEQRFTSKYNGDENFLMDHRVGEEKILPGVAYLEMARAAGSISLEDSVRQIKDVLWLKPLSVNGKPKEVQISLFEEGSSVNYEVYSINDGKEVINAHGTLSTERPSTPTKFNIEEIRKRLPHVLGGVECYKIFKRRGIHYGYSFQGIKNLYHSEEEALSKVIVPKTEGYMLPPELLDSALQTCVGLTFNRANNTLSLPYSVKEVNIYGNVEEACWCYVTKISKTQSSDSINDHNVYLLGEDGNVLLSFKNFLTLPYDQAVDSKVNVSKDMGSMKEDEIKDYSPFHQICYLGALKVLVGLGIEPHLNKSIEEMRQSLLIIDKYDRLFEELIRDLTINGYLEQQNEEILIPDRSRTAIENFHLQSSINSACLNNPDFKGNLTLLNNCLQSFGDILLGKVRATDIIFPQGKMDLVSSAYNGNPVADFFNSCLCNTVKDLVREGVGRLKAGEKFTIMEVGAGTGGTSSLLFKCLKDYNEYIRYIYTDCSRSFLLHAEEHYQQVAPYLETRLFDIERSPQVQDLELASCDIVIGANVVHATKNISRTIRNIKQVLKNDGLLILNEIAKTDIFATLIFGLLDGWWLFEDKELRLQGSPGLNHDSWQKVLSESGFFNTLVFPNNERCTQQIIVAQNINAGEFLVDATIPLHERNTFKSNNYSSSHDVADKAVAFLKSVFGQVLKMNESRIDEKASFETMGVDSIVIGNLTKQLNRHFEFITTTTFFEYRNIHDLAIYLAQEYGSFFHTSEFETEEKSTPAVEQKSEELQSNNIRRQRRTEREGMERTLSENGNSGIAIIGISGRYPGANSMDDFWENLKSGKDCITEIPKTRWNIDKYFDPEKGVAGKINCRWGGFIEDVDKFDPLFFKISPTEAEKMDPQERLFLQTAWEAIEDAGYSVSQLSHFSSASKVRTGVYVGVMYEEYQLFGAEQRLLGNPLTIAGSPSSIANRVSYFCDFNGPSIAVDTMCSSSLTAIHIACNDLINGDADVAIAGGVNVSIHPNKYLILSQNTFLSGKGRCESFGSGGEGFVPAEGVGAIVLKPLSKAIADGDQIYGVIKGSSLNHGGKANGYTVPNPNAQADVIIKAIEKAKVNAEEFSYIEAHGTGTTLGDPIEIAGLSKAFSKNGKAGQYCAIGSVKSNIGHAESAAGISGLTKILLQLKYKKLVPSLHAERLNERIEFEKTPFKVQRKLEDWKSPDGKPRLAGISSFGAGGSNAHLIVEEYVPKEKKVYNGNKDALIILSAKNKEALRRQVENLNNYLLAHGNLDLESIAYTLQLGREAMEERLGFIVSNVNELSVKLRMFLDGSERLFFQGNMRETSLDGYTNIEEERQKVSRAIEKRSFEVLADLWCKGVSIDWQRLYIDYKPLKISLPTYPFAKRRCWISEENIYTEGSTPIANQVSLPVANSLDENNQKDKEQFKGDEKRLTLPAVESGLYYKPLWKRVEFSEDNFLSDNIYKVNVLLGNPGRFAEELKTHLESKGIVISISNDSNEIPTSATSIYFLHGLENSSAGNIRSQIEEQEIKVFNWIKSLQSRRQEKLCLTFLTKGTQMVKEGDIVQTVGAGIVGLAGSLAKEYPMWNIRVVDFDIADEPSAELLEKVSFSKLGNIHAIRNKVLYHCLLVPLDTRNSILTGGKLKKGGVYVILGGAGGLGKVTSEYLIKNYDARIYWLGRREKDHSIASAIEQLSKNGIAPVYVQCDATDSYALASAYKYIRSRETKVDGLFHSAIVLHDMSLSNMQESDFRKSFEPKSISSDLFVKAFKDERLDFICFYSSIQSHLNAAGQANYSAGCTFKDSYARSIEHKSGIPCYTINWGYWGEVGVVSSESYNKRMTALGIGSISDAEGMHALEFLLAGDIRQMSVIKVMNEEGIKNLPILDLKRKIVQQTTVSSLKLTRKLMMALED